MNNKHFLSDSVIERIQRGASLLREKRIEDTLTNESNCVQIQIDDLLVVVVETTTSNSLTQSEKNPNFSLYRQNCKGTEWAYKNKDGKEENFGLTFNLFRNKDNGSVHTPKPTKF